MAFIRTSSFDRRSSTLAILSTSYAIQGHSGRARALAAQAVQEAAEIGQPFPLCEASIWTICTSLLIGEPPEGIEADAEKLVALAGANGWVAHEALGRAWLALARARQGRMEGVAESLQASLHVLRQARYGSFNPLILAELAAILSASGRVAEALSLIAEHHQKDGNPEIWCGPELLRREAELRLSTSDQETARQCLLRARQWSEAQGARLWLDFLAPSESLGIARA